MRKHKIKGLAKYASLCEERVIKGQDGTEVTVRTHIPYADKTAMAQEITEQIVMVHDDSCWYISYNREAIVAKAILKYYTDLNVDDADPDEIMDFLINNGLYDQVMDVCGNDVEFVDQLVDGMTDGFVTVFDDDRSLAKAVRTSFGFLFNGEDITESLAKAEMAKDTLYNAVGALREKEEEEAKKLNDGSLSIDGNIIQFGKRE